MIEKTHVHFANFEENIDNVYNSTIETIDIFLKSKILLQIAQPDRPWMNEWMTVYPYSHMWTFREGATWKLNAYNEIYSSNSWMYAYVYRQLR